MSAETKEKFDWESSDYSRRTTHGRTQEKTVYHPCEYEKMEYVIWKNRFRMPAIDMPNDHHVFRKHGMEPHSHARLSVTGAIDFINAAGDLYLTIDIVEADDEVQYLKELLDQLKLAKAIIKDRLSYLQQKTQ